ncbi:MAG: hypothetical protein ACOH1T_01055 [Microbacteriaceae bacterium]
MASPRQLTMSALAFTGILLLAGCAGEAPADTAPTPEITAGPTADPSPSEDPAVFTLPTTCDALLSEERAADFATQRLALLGGPGGKYGTDYLADPTPEESAGGITCIWGFDDTDFASVTISVAPLSQADRAGVVTGLLDQGLNEKVDGSTTSYIQQGDANSQPAIINVLRADSWISVIETVGGEEFYAEAVMLAEDVYGQAYAEAP